MLGRSLPTDAKRRSVASKLRWILKRYNVEQGTVTMKVEKSLWLPSSLIRKTLAATLAETEDQKTVEYAMDSLTLVRTKVPTIHSAGRQHRVFAKSFEEDIHWKPMTLPWREQYSKGVSLKFLPESWDVPLPGHQPRLLGQILSGGFRLICSLLPPHAGLQ